MVKIVYTAKMRLKANQYAYATAFKRLKEAIKQKDNNEVYSSIGELLLWVITTEEWHWKYNEKQYKQEKKLSEGDLVVFRLRHANNMVKHNMQFLQIFNKRDSSGFNSSGFNKAKFNQPVEYRWLNAKNVLDTDDSHENQVENYIKYIEDREIIGTFDKAITFLNKVGYPFLLGKHDI